MKKNDKTPAKRISSGAKKTRRPLRLAPNKNGNSDAMRASEITGQKQAEEDLKRSHSLLNATLESTADGILVVANDGKVASYNRKFLDLWGIPEDLAAQKDDRVLLESVLNQLKAPAAFISKVEALYQSPETTSFDELEFLDGRIFERYSQPQRLGDTILGRVWSFRDVTERKQAEKALRESESRLLTVLEASPIPITLNSLDNGVLLYGNSAFAELLRVSPSEIIGRSAASYYADAADRSRALNELERLGSLRDYEVRLRRPDGSLLWVSLSTEVTALDGQPCLLSSFYDITGRKQAEALQAAIYQISEAANNVISLNELFQSVHQIIGRVMLAQNFYIALYDSENDLLSFPYYVDEVDGSESIPATKPGRGMTEYLIRTGRPLLSDADNFEELARQGEVELVGPASPIWVGAPLLVDGRTIGAIALQDYHNPNVYTERELRMLEFVSGQVARAIERTRLMEDVQRNNRILSALQEATLPLIKRTELSEVLQEILSQATGLFDTKNGFIFLVKPDQTELVQSMAIGQSQYIGTRLKRGEGLAGKVWQTGSPINVQDYQTWSGRSDLFSKTAFYSVIGVPLISREQVIGVLGVTNLEPEQVFSNDDTELLSRFAELASIAIENARLYTLSQQELAERKFAEEALREAEEKYRGLVERLPVVVYTSELGVAGAWQYISPQIESLLGFTQEEWMADPHLWYRQVHPDDRDRQASLEQQSYVRGEPFEGEYRIFTRDNREIWVRDSAQILPPREGGLPIVQGVLVDITARKNAENAFLISRAQLLANLENTPNVAVQWYDENGRTLYWNPASESLYGWKSADAIGKTLDQLIHTPEEQAEFMRILQEVRETGKPFGPYEARIRHKEGNTGWVLATTFSMPMGEGQIGFVCMDVDITERKQAESLQSAIYRISDATSSSGGMDEFYRAIHQSLQGVIIADNFFIGLYDKTTDLLSFPYYVDQYDPTPSTAPLGRGLAAYVIRNGIPLLGRPDAIQKLEDGGEVESVGTRSIDWLGVPLKIQNETIGVMAVQTYTEGIRYIQRDLDILGFVSVQVALSIERKQAEEKIKWQVERLKALRTIDMFIAGGTDLHLTLQTILNQAISRLGVDAADILLLDTSIHMLEYAEGVGFRTRGVDQTSIRIGEGFAGKAVLEREMVSSHDLPASKEPFIRQAFQAGEGFISYYGVPLIAKGEVKGVLEIFHRSPLNVDSEWMDFLESLAGQAALAIDNASLFDSLQRSNLELGLAYETTLEGWSAALDLRDKETEGHTQRVTNLTLKLAEAMGLSEKERVHMRRGALLHDIGKMGIPDRILLKPDQLTSDEWEIMRQHPIYAHNLLSPIAHLRPALDIPYCHHEKWDGTGYPRGLKSEAIPLSARIFAVADVWDALCSDRPYRPAWAKEKALEHIKSLSGTHFDSKVVTMFLQVLDQG